MAARICFCCINLRIGCFVIAYLTLVHRLSMFGLQMYYVLQVYSIMSSDSSFIPILMSVFAIIKFFYLILTIVLLIGLHMNKPKPVLAFLVLTAVFFIIEHILNYWIIIKYAKFYKLYEWCMVVVAFVVTCLYVYFFCVIRSYYLEMSTRKVSRSLKMIGISSDNHV